MLLFAVGETGFELLPASGLMSAFKYAECMRREMVKGGTKECFFKCIYILVHICILVMQVEMRQKLLEAKEKLKGEESVSEDTPG